MSYAKLRPFASAAARVAAVTLLAVASPLSAQERTATDLDSLVARALAFSPSIQAARARVDAARARIRSASALADPMLGVGLMNLPVNGNGYDDMTMNAVIVEQMLPYPGRLRLQREVATAEAALEDALVQGVARDVEREVRRAYYDIAYADRALDVLERAQELAATLAQSAASRYSVGAGSQPDVLRMQVETARIAEEAAMLSELRRSSLHRLNSLLGETAPSVIQATVPERIARAAVAADRSAIRFAGNTLGARVTDSPVPSLETLQRRAPAANAELRAQDARIAAQLARIRVAEQAHRPDFNVELQYGQRPHRPDMVSLMISVPVPVRRSAKQQQDVLAARAELTAMQMERTALGLELSSEIAEMHGELEAIRAQLALYVRSILPQGRAALESAATGYAAGVGEFAALLENRATLVAYELAWERGIADFARKLADLERRVGSEILQ